MIGYALCLDRILVVVAVLFSSPSIAQTNAPGQTPPPAVVTERIKTQEIASPAEFTARVEAIRSVDIRARIQGFLQSVGFQDGQTVTVGDTLFEIQPDQFQASVESAQAQVMRAEAAQNSDEKTLQRNRELFDRKTVSQASLDKAQAAFDVATADVKVAEAALRTARLNLSYTHITAPITGKIGKPTLTAGNLVGPDSGTLARIVSLDPIRVAFSMTEGLLVTLRQEQSKGGGIDPNTLRFTLKLANGTTYDKTGKLDYVDNEIDPKTGTATVRAIFPNPDHVLIPGQFVSLDIREKNAPRMPVVPQTAVLQDQGGRFVYVLGKNNVVSKRRIETGARTGSGWAVSEGLGADDVVVVQGIQRLSDGITVQPHKANQTGSRS